MISIEIKILFFIICIVFGVQFSVSMSSPYEVLRYYGLPIGLLPKGVTNFELYDDGRFEAELEAPCTAKFENEVMYNNTVSGFISTGQIAGLSGISAQDLFLWFPVRAIRLDNYTVGIIHFDVGVVDKRYPLSLFEFPPDCWPVTSGSMGGKGFDGGELSAL